MNGLFITGTDTDIGKTLVTALLTAYYIRKGKKVIPYKPVQSGAVIKNGELTAPDVQVYELACSSFNLKAYNTYLLAKPCSPHLAAREENSFIDPQKIKSDYMRLAETYDMILAEGAGGLIVPLNDDGYCIIDLIKELSLPAVLVARTGVGTINHTVLSVRALQQARIPIAGIIMNRTNEDELAVEEDNRTMIEKLTNIPVLGVIPYIDNIEYAVTNDAVLDEIFANFNFDRLGGIANGKSASASS